jgi:translation initiation factor 6 (eIF-6)
MNHQGNAGNRILIEDNFGIIPGSLSESLNGRINDIRDISVVEYPREKEVVTREDSIEVNDHGT